MSSTGSPAQGDREEGGRGAAEEAARLEPRRGAHARGSDPTASGRAVARRRGGGAVRGAPARQHRLPGRAQDADAVPRVPGRRQALQAALRRVRLRRRRGGRDDRRGADHRASGSSWSGSSWSGSSCERIIVRARIVVERIVVVELIIVERIIMRADRRGADHRASGDDARRRRRTSARVRPQDREAEGGRPHPAQVDADDRRHPGRRGVDAAGDAQPPQVGRSELAQPRVVVAVLGQPQRRRRRSGFDGVTPTLQVVIAGGQSGAASAAGVRLSARDARRAGHPRAGRPSSTVARRRRRRCFHAERDHGHHHQRVETAGSRTDLYIRFLLTASK